ncbi:MAG: Stp1/IreP family PP2C-type Ser/Thr phosphatase [Thermoanaerobaculia bacterium]|nr:Stp1/IreP family PP2C-type Ser/Thr phosphatase [Thermoanaerobaculia bacterium]
MSESAATIGDAAGGRLVVRAALRTDVGKVRSENQDFGTLTSAEEERHSRLGGRLLIVADGMGGHRGGATASRLSAETVKAQYIASDTSDVAEALRISLRHANARIFGEAQSNPDLRGMGTTTSALAVQGNHAWFAHVGDSRIYLVRGGEIKQLTDDHSLVASMVREGLLTNEEAAHHPRRNVLQRSMGVGEEVEIDVRGPFDLREGDVFVLCSDGLHGLVREDEMREVAISMEFEAASDELLRRALDRGAPDNVTVIVARVERDVFDDDQTIVERTLEERMSLDETLVDTVEHHAPEHPSGRDTIEVTAPGVVRAPAPSPSSTPTLELPFASTPPAPLATPRVAAPPPPVTAPRRSSSRSILKWMLLFLIVLGAAGGWVYWNQQQKQPRTTAPSSTGR